MLRYLLDEQISPKVAKQLAARIPDIQILVLREWDSGKYLGLRDEAILGAAHSQSLTLVTYDQRTIAPLLKSWAEQGIPHGGVIFVDERTLAPNDFGGLVRGLESLWLAQRELNWENRVVFLTK